MTVVRNKEGTVKGFKNKEFFIQFQTDDQAFYLTVGALTYQSVDEFAISAEEI